MRVLETRAPAKINVCLFLGPRRADGRHELVSVMQSVSLTDKLRLEPADGAGDEVRCAGVDGDNLVTDAIAAFRAATRWDGDPVRISIKKRIPVAAGMAGGSADAGAALRLLAQHAGRGDREQLLAIGALLGADVPAQVRPGRVLATGAGEVIARVPGVAR
jgi:4-diphosphocytidyl-2-C-methyl-D-erythritol kinase